MGNGLERKPGASTQANAADEGAHAVPGKSTLVDRTTSTSDLAAGLAQERDGRPGNPGAGGQPRFRLPTGADMKSMLAKGDITESQLKDSIATALQRMAKEGRLKTKDTVPDIIKKVFPSAGKFDEVEFGKVVDTTDRSQIYKTVVDAQTKVSSTDKPKLIGVMDDAVKEIGTAMADAKGLKEVFGTKATLAKGIYDDAAKAIGKLKLKMDTKVHTDYNRDDEEVGLGGWADHGSQQVHLQRKVAEVQDKNGATTTIIHEASHLANGGVDDRGYYGSPGFEAMTEDEKLGNAAHFEEIPRRQLGTSKYPTTTFKPGITSGGGAVTFEDEVRRKASEYLRKAWDKSVDVHMFLRGIRQDIEGGSTASFVANKARILEVSKLEKLTIHLQKTPSTINMNDIVLCEGVAHATIAIRQAAKAQAVPAAPASGKTQQDYVTAVIDGAIKSYGALTGNDADDKKLMDWLVKEYRKSL